MSGCPGRCTLNQIGLRLKQVSMTLPSQSLWKPWFITLFLVHEFLFTYCNCNISTNNWIMNSQVDPTSLLLHCLTTCYVIIASSCQGPGIKGLLLLTFLLLSLSPYFCLSHCSSPISFSVSALMDHSDPNFSASFSPNKFFHIRLVVHMIFLYKYLHLML